MLLPFKYNSNIDTSYMLDHYKEGYIIHINGSQATVIYRNNEFGIVKLHEIVYDGNNSKELFYTDVLKPGGKCEKCSCD